MTKKTVENMSNEELLSLFHRSTIEFAKSYVFSGKASKKTTSENELALQELCRRLDIEYVESNWYK